MEIILIILAILLPVLSAVLCFAISNSTAREVVVIISSVIMIAVAGALLRLLILNNGLITITIGEGMLDIGWVIKFLDAALLIYIAYIGFKLRKPIVVILTIAQFIPFAILEIFMNVHEPTKAFVIDYLSMIMILIVSIIGPIITVFSTGYMKRHEHHAGITRTRTSKSRQPRFFFIVFIFLGAMNALVITNNLMWMYFFWEVTTLCSFLLISHDGTTESVQNAIKALWMNSLGGVAFILGIVSIYVGKNTLSIFDILAFAQSKDLGRLLPIGIALLCFAGFTKAAQFPFQSWLLGAMVAPTPVSALLHSSTMVKAGVFLIVRMAPLMGIMMLGEAVAFVGGFTFLVASAIAISQRNAKRVLAYSTVANLGLIICCAGIGTGVAIGAAVMLIIFHAISKGMLFLCVGTIEQQIGSRDIEDMQGLLKRMPFTTIVTVIGMISMLLPPFGVLITKWLAIESAVNLPVLLIMIILGSAFTTVFWAKWIGIILTTPYKTKPKKEKLFIQIRSSLLALLTGVIVASVGIVPLYNILIKPYVNSLKLEGGAKIVGDNIGITIVQGGAQGAIIGAFAAILFFVVVLLVIITIPYFIRRTKPESKKSPYLCGASIKSNKESEFMGPGQKIETSVVHNYYLEGYFGEKHLTLWSNRAAILLIIIVFGVVANL